MRRRRLLGAAAALLLLGAGAGAALTEALTTDAALGDRADEPSPTTTLPPAAPGTPVYEADFPDPHLLRVAEGYVAYATNVEGVGHVPAATSKDLATWTSVGDVLPELPAWVAAPVEDRVWAPSVELVGGRFVLAVTVPDAPSGRQCIGIGTAEPATGPFTLAAAGPLVCQADLGGSIDPHLFVDGDQVWLLWKSDENSIGRRARLWSQQLDPRTLELVGEPAILLEMSEAWEGAVRAGTSSIATIENPAMARVGGELHLVYSGGDWRTRGYAMGHAHCESPGGPCTRSSSVPFLAADRSIAGAGGGMLFEDRHGTLWLAHHAWQTSAVGYDAGGRRALYLRRVLLAPDALLLPE